MKRVYQILSYILVAVLASLVTLFYCNDNRQPTYSKLDQLSDLIEECFIGESDRVAYEDAAADAMVNALGDEWSYYIPADQYQTHVESVENAYVGIGITILVREEGDGFSVTKVNAGGPAEEAGMLAGDVIIGIEGRSAESMSADDAKSLVCGEVDTQVLLTIRRGEQIMDLTVTRRKVLTPVATGQMLEDHIGLVTIANFNSRCYKETRAAIESLRDQGAEALILDIRNNPGGYKRELVDLLDYLLPAGPLFRAEDYRGVVEVNQSDDNYLDIPMVVLVNGYSYSAAEFFAAAMSEYEAAVIVGQQTYGKGYFQMTFQLNDGSMVGLSVGKYTTPNGNSLVGVGITPDIVVEVDEETDFMIYAGVLDPADDPQIQAAVGVLKSK